MKKFITLYWLNIALLFAIFYWELSPIADIINSLQTDLTTYLTAQTLEDELMRGYEILINSHYSLVIEKACNGLIPYLFFLASIIAFPSTIIHKVKWALIGYILLTFINTFRIWLITQLVLSEVGNFSLAHDFVGNAMLIFTSLLLFILFVKSRYNSN